MVPTHPRSWIRIAEMRPTKVLMPNRIGLFLSDSGCHPHYWERASVSMPTVLRFDRFDPEPDAEAFER